MLSTLAPLLPGLLSQALSQRPRPRHQDLNAYLKALGDLLGGGLDLATALEIAADLMPNKRFRHACLDQADAIRQGMDWDTALADCRWLRWPDLTRAWIRLGLETGFLADCLRLHHQERQETRSFTARLAQKLAYPIGVLCMSGALGQLMSSILPATETAWLNTTTSQCLVLTLCMVATAWGLWYWYRPDAGHDGLGWWRSLTALSLCTRAGLSLPHAIDPLRAPAVGLLHTHPRVLHALSECLDRIERGDSLESAVQASQFPKSSWYCLRTASLTGNLPLALEQAAGLLRIQVNHLRDRLMQTLPPIGLATAAANLCMQYLLFVWPLYQNLSAS